MSVIREHISACTQESPFTSDIFLPYLTPSCPFACCNEQLIASETFSNYRRPRYSMPVPPSSSPPPMHYQIVPIRHSISYHQLVNSMQQQNAHELNSFQPYQRDTMIIDENGNRQLANNNSSIKNLDAIRASPYYYNELTGMHATNESNLDTTFCPINNRSESFADFMTSMYPDNA